jgi:FAD/FMN-containing dehydrogenase
VADFAIHAPTLELLMEITGAIERTLDPVALEWIGGHAPIGGRADRNDAARTPRLLVRLAGNADTVDWSSAELRRISPDAERLQAGHIGNNGEAGAAFALRLTALPSLLPELWRTGADLATRLGMHNSGSDNDSAGPAALRATAHAGAGIVRVWGELRAEAADAACIDVIERARADVHSLGGTLTVQAVPAGRLRGLDFFGPPPEAIALMRAAAARLDPAGILVPGRTVLSHR